jgi:opacity protein-like surface antigen
MKKLAVVLAVMVIGYGTAAAAVQFVVGPGFNMYSDTRITGINTMFGFSYDLENFTVGYKVEQGNLTITDANVGVVPAAIPVNFRVAAQINTIEVSKEIVKPAGLPVSVGLELGSIVTTGLFGTIAAPAGISQVSPLVGIFGGVSYESTGKQVTTSLMANIGYRFIDISDIAVPGGFVAGGKNFTDLNAITLNLGIALKF